MGESPLAYLPHRPPMALIDSIESVDEESMTCTCRFAVPRDFFLAGSDGRLPACVLVEVMAQAAACCKGWIDVHRGRPVKVGYLVGVDTARFGAQAAPGDALVVRARLTREVSEYCLFSCAVSREEGELCEAVLGVMTP